MDDYIKKKRILKVAEVDHPSDVKSKIVDAVKSQFQGIGESVKDLFNRFRVLEQIVKKVGVIDEESKGSRVLEQPSMQQPYLENQLPDWKTHESNQVIQQPLQLGPAEKLASQINAISNRVKENDSVIKKLQQPSQIIERTKRIKKRT